MGVGNFITQLLGPVGGPRALPQHIPSFDPGPSRYASDAPPMQTGPSPMDMLAYAQENYTPQAPAPNVLQTLASGGNTNTASRPGGRSRRSLLDIIGGVADTFASVGGADPLYRMNLDARDERVRQVDLGAMQREQFEMQQRAGDQSFRAGEMEIANVDRERIGAALGGIIGAENPAEAWMQVAEQAGIDPQRAAAIGQAIQRNPEIVESLATSMGFEPPRQGSQAKELQVYAMLQSQDPALANRYLQSLANPDSMTPYEQARLRLDMAKLEQDQYQFENPQPTAAERTAASEAATAAQQRAEAAQSGLTLISGMRDAFGRLKEAGGINAAGQSGEQRVGAWALENVPFAERVFTPEGFSAREDINRLLGQSVMSLTPLLGGITIGGKNIDAAKELEFHRNNVASAKDYDSAIRALDAYEKRVTELIQAAAAPAPAPSRRSAPAPRRTHDRATLDQQATTEQGYRYAPGPGGRANRANWTKVG